jgi:hypothetical protein
MTGFWDQVFEINNFNRIASVNNFLDTKPFIILQEGLRVWTVFPSKLHLVLIIWYQAGKANRDSAFYYLQSWLSEYFQYQRSYAGCMPHLTELSVDTLFTQI